MKKVFLIVNLVDEKGNLAYLINYTGVMTRRNIYAKLTQNTNCPDPEYVKVSKWDTVDETANWESIFPETIFRSISVSSNIAMDDSRIQKEFDIPDGILEAIDSHIQENQKIMAAR